MHVHIYIWHNNVLVVIHMLYISTYVTTCTNLLHKQILCIHIKVSYTHIHTYIATQVSNNSNLTGLQQTEFSDELLSDMHICTYVVGMYGYVRM